MAAVIEAAADLQSKDKLESQNRTQLTGTPSLEYAGSTMTAMEAATSHPRRELAPAAVRAFARLAEIWRLSGAQQARLLGLEPTQLSTLYKWKSRPEAANLSHDALDRVSYLIGIYKSLHMLLPDDAAADGWIRRKNEAPIFGGRSALELMLGGSMHDLFLVHSYLDAERG